MEFRQLIFFKKAAELEHITKAAEELNTSQPFLSKTISALETELGVSLFDHAGRSIRLNQYGKLFYQKVCSGLQEIENGKREIQDLYVQAENQIHIITNSGLYMPEILSKFRQFYPHIQIRQISAPRHQMIKMLQSGHVDFAICSPALTEDESFENQVLLHETCDIIYPPSHWLNTRETITLTELANEFFITAPTGFAIRDQSDLFFKEAGFTPNYTIQSTDTYHIPAFVKQGFGIAFAPHFFLNYSPSLKKHSIKVTFPVCEGNVTLTWKKHRYLNQTCQIFQDFLSQYFQSTQP